MLRLLDARTGSPAEVRPARPGVLRVCAHVQQDEAGSGISALRVLLVADLLARTAELTGLQVLTTLEISGPPVDQAAALESDADALGIHPPTARTSAHDAPSPLGGPIVFTCSARAPAWTRARAGWSSASVPRIWAGRIAALTHRPAACPPGRGTTRSPSGSR